LENSPVLGPKALSYGTLGEAQLVFHPSGIILKTLSEGYSDGYSSIDRGLIQETRPENFQRIFGLTIYPASGTVYRLYSVKKSQRSCVS